MEINIVLVMSTFKKAKVVMLSTNEKTNIINTNQGLLYNSNDYIGINHKGKYYLKTETGYREVLATTDTSLNLPQPSKQFIEKYIEEYNKGNVITDVLVEYELISNEEYFGNTVNPDDDVPYFDEKLKINPKDNSLNICFIDKWIEENL